MIKVRTKDLDSAEQHRQLPDESLLYRNRGAQIGTRQALGSTSATSHSSFCAELGGAAIGWSAPRCPVFHFRHQIGALANLT